MQEIPERGQHCPFLNRTDERCSEHFTLDRLEHAFAHCFDRYNTCSLYLELLVERRLKRGEARELAQHGAADGHRPLVQLTIHATRPSKALVEKVAARAIAITPAAPTARAA